VTNLPASLGRKPVVTLQLGQETRAKLLANFQALNLSGAAAQTWARWLKGNDPYLALTFDPATAADKRDLAFITPTHPWLARPPRPWNRHPPGLQPHRQGNMTCRPAAIPTPSTAGAKIGLKEDFTFQPSAADPAISARMLELLETAVPVDSPVRRTSRGRGAHP
jgi:ATP-dependent helicase HepA